MMSATRHDPLHDPADLAVVALLREAGRGAPASVDVDALLHRSRRSARRHRLGTVAGGAFAAAALVVAAVGLGSGWVRPDAAPAPLPASATSTAASTPSPSATTGATWTGTATGTATGEAPSTARPGSLQAILGAGWAPDAAGDLALDPASAAADGLPAAFTAKATRSSVPARLTDLCRGFTEKGATFTPCEVRTALDGTAVSRMVMDARLSPPGSYAALRYLRDAGGGQVEYAQVSVTAEGTTVDRATYDAAVTWLGRYDDRLAAAAAVDVPPGR